jgi:ribosomal protein S27AE
VGKQRQRKAGSSVGPQWEAQAEEAFTDLRGWRELHPRASLREIEQELDRRWERLRAKVLADLALASVAADLQQGEDGARPTCPDCGVVLQDQGAHRRTLMTLGNQAVELRRDYGTCPRCGSGLFPPGR